MLRPVALLRATPRAIDTPTANDSDSGRWPGTVAQQTQTVEPDQDRRAFVTGNPQRQRRLAGLVKTRRVGTFVYYSPAPDHDVLRVLSQALVGADAPQPISTA